MQDYGKAFVLTHLATERASDAPGWPSVWVSLSPETMCSGVRKREEVAGGAGRKRGCWVSGGCNCRVLARRTACTSPSVVWGRGESWGGRGDEGGIRIMVIRL